MRGRSLGLCCTFFLVRLQGVVTSSHGFPFQGNGVGVVDQSVQDGVGEGGIAQVFMPVGDRQLRGDEDGATLAIVSAGMRDVATLPRPAKQPGSFPNLLLWVILGWHWHPPIGGVSNNTLQKVSVLLLVIRPLRTASLACFLPVTHES